jgi:hypothetical protein
MRLDLRVSDHSALAAALRQIPARQRAAVVRETLQSALADRADISASLARIAAALESIAAGAGDRATAISAPPPAAEASPAATLRAGLAALQGDDDDWT